MSLKSIQLREVLPLSHFIGCHDITTSNVSSDSRTIQPGDLFVAVRGTATDGHEHIDAAIAGGCSALVVTCPFPEIGMPQCVVPCCATAHAHIRMALQMADRTPPVCVGVTGTNGKTTTTWMLRSILQAAGISTGLIGTIENDDGHTVSPAVMTTPDASDIATRLRDMVDRQTTHCALEISSHALDQQRCAAVRLQAGAITNITHDHLDYHGSLDNYAAAKWKIADLLEPWAPLLLNLDDPVCRQLASKNRDRRIVTCSTGSADADLRATLVSETHRSQTLRLELTDSSVDVRMRLIGRHNAENALAAAGLAELLGVGCPDIVDGLQRLRAVPGRMERLDEGQSFQVYVDYAHTADALALALQTIKDFVPGRLFCVFGAGGDRDHSKRAGMGQAAGAADVCILTSDNPRTEAPEQIIQDVMEGVPRKSSIVREPDRRVAIQYALSAAEPGDAILIAGKGHEGVQQVSRQSLPFDDRMVTRQLLKAQLESDPWSAVDSVRRIA